jgi:hypothetical protein
MENSHKKVPEKYQVLDNLRAIVMEILKGRSEEDYWREKWAQYKGRRKWREIKPKKPDKA